jgi:hypothetical protein
MKTTDKALAIDCVELQRSIRSKKYQQIKDLSPQQMAAYFLRLRTQQKKKVKLERVVS